MLEEEIIILEKYRNDKNIWNDLAYKNFNYEKNFYTDNNALKRYQVIKTLQYDLKPNDQDLLKFLLEQEIKKHQKETFQGIDDSIKLVSFLLSKFKNIDNVWLFTKAKIANFDTLCGFDLEFLFSAGLNKTINYVRDSDNKLKKKFFSFEQEFTNLTENLIKDWFISKSKYYPEKIDENNLLQLADLTMKIQQYQQTKKYLKKWQNEQVNSEKVLEILHSYYFQMNDIKELIEINTLLLKYKETNWEKVSCLSSLAALNVKDNNPLKAWEILKLIDSLFEEFDDWKETGLGRSVMETALNTVISLKNNQKLGTEIFNWVEKNFGLMKNLSNNLFEKARIASNVLELKDKEDYYQKIYNKKHKKLLKDLEK